MAETAHQDVAGVVERLRDCANFFASDYSYNRADHCNEVATLIESLFKAPSEAEAERDRVKVDCAVTSNSHLVRAEAAESRLAEAMSHLQAMHRYASRNEAGPEIDAARRFLNAGKE